MEKQIIGFIILVLLIGSILGLVIYSIGLVNAIIVAAVSVFATWLLVFAIDLIRGGD